MTMDDERASGRPESGRDAARTATVVTTEDDWDAAVAIRMAVFVDEQGVPEHLELDEHDEDPSTPASITC
ncbi:hypothetical protein ACFQFH_06705 [Halobaculum halobium]|uniref:hypothetical protein n=1 Tax=Halobaculum halobium TaxID=3032281 RepID=UPI0036160949